MAAVAVAPTTIYFCATNNFVRYGGGVFSDPTCSAANINHAMVAVGYYWSGTSSSSYWIIKNSWGTGWGKDGLTDLGGNLVRGAYILGPETWMNTKYPAGYLLC